MTRITTTIGAVLVPGLAAAHPDHTTGGDFGLAHFLTDPFHVALTCGTILLLAAVWRWARRSRAAVRKAE